MSSASNSARAGSTIASSATISSAWRSRRAARAMPGRHRAQSAPDVSTNSEASRGGRRGAMLRAFAAELRAAPDQPSLSRTSRDFPGAEDFRRFQSRANATDARVRRRAGSAGRRRHHMRADARDGTERRLIGRVRPWAICVYEGRFAEAVGSQGRRGRRRTAGNSDKAAVKLTAVACARCCAETIARRSPPPASASRAAIRCPYSRRASSRRPAHSTSAASLAAANQLPAEPQAHGKILQGPIA